MRISQTNNINILYQEIGQRIKRARESKKLTQEQLGIKIKLSRTSITNLEKGNQNISLQTLSKISDVLNIDISDLLPKTKGKERINDIQVKEMRIKLYTLIKYVTQLEKIIQTLRVEIKNML